MKEWNPKRSTFNRIKNNNRIVRFMFEEMHHQQIHECDMSLKIGFHRDTLRKWRTHHQPRITDIEACLDYLGYRLTVVRKVERKHKMLLSDGDFEVLVESFKKRESLATVMADGIHAADISEYQDKVQELDLAVFKAVAMPLYLAGGNPLEGYAPRVEGRKEELHQICNQSGESSEPLNSQFADYSFLMNNTVNEIHWNSYYHGDYEKCANQYIKAIADTDLV